MDLMNEEIKRLKKERNAVILAHYYVPDDVQAVADKIGDSFYLSKIATQIQEDVLVFCGVSFMGESAKILNPSKTVLLPDQEADCPMAHMATIEKIEEVRRAHPEAAVVCYVNSTAELKAHADVCVTSSNAVKIVRALENPIIYFIPDKNLGQYVAQQVPEKTFLFNDGYCPIHNRIDPKQVELTKAQHPKAPLLVHPECTPEVLKLADFIGSTSEIIAYAAKSSQEEFLIGTETGVFYELQQNNPHKRFIPASSGQVCPGMKRITLEKVRDCLKNMSTPVEMEEDLRKRANLPLLRMLELAK